MRQWQINVKTTDLFYHVAPPANELVPSVLNGFDWICEQLGDQSAVLTLSGNRYQGRIIVASRSDT